MHIHMINKCLYIHTHIKIFRHYRHTHTHGLRALIANETVYRRQKKNHKVTTIIETLNYI